MAVFESDYFDGFPGFFLDEDIQEGNELYHYGKSKLDGAPGRGSGRYPLGSGEDPNQHRGDLISRVQELRKSGMSEIDIARAVGFESTGQLRKAYSNAVNQRRATQISSARAMLADGMTQAQVARELGINESTLRSLLNERSEARTRAAKATADFLRAQIQEKGMIDVGTGVELELGISREKLGQALQILQDEGYPVYGGGVPQVTNPGKQTNIKVICPPGTEHREIYDFENVHTIRDYKLRTDDDGTERFEKGFEYPASMDGGRLMIRFRDDKAPDGHTGVEKDGTVELRRGVPDLDLQGSHYAQVRILVDGNKYIKGMATYSDDMPDGVDVIFNTNKTRDQADKVLKPIKDDPSNPFGALLREEGGQYHYDDPETGERKLGLINKTRTEGDWGDWADSLPSQFLSKQSMQLINKQLGLSIADKRAEFESIMALENPTVKKQLLETFANDCDSAAVHLQAAALPRQKYQVILPIATMKDNEVYAPNYRDGETVALIRYPHGGTFEIPILTVNNRHPDGRRILGNTPADAIGINSKVAERLSGADFDGDTVMVIPCNGPGSKVKITATRPLEGLKDFDPKMEYGSSRVETDSNGDKHYYRDGHEFKIMTNTQMEMGKVSNLITDMTLKGATTDELARAVRHSMVVIDAEKHKLDWKQSELDNGIAALRKKYQEREDEDGGMHYGASTLISRAKSPVAVLKRKGTPKINPETGELEYKEVREEYVDKTGKVRLRTQDSTLMAETKDARKLSSGTEQEEAYATYANAMKAMGNEARKAILTAGKIEYSAAAKDAYADVVSDLNTQLKVALMNAPRERQAQLAANSEVKAMKRANPDMTRKEIKKKGQQALSRNRIKYGAQRQPIEITPRAWEAIQAGAISENLLSKILRFADQDQVRAYATPRASSVLSAGEKAKIKAMQNSGYTTSQIAAAIGKSTFTVSKFMNGKE